MPDAVSGWSNVALDCPTVVRDLPGLRDEAADLAGLAAGVVRLAPAEVLPHRRFLRIERLFTPSHFGSLSNVSVFSLTALRCDEGCSGADGEGVQSGALTDRETETGRGTGGDVAERVDRNAPRAAANRRPPLICRARHQRRSTPRRRSSQRR